MQTPKIVVVVSGGMDSVTLLHSAVAHTGPKRVKAISFNYKQRHAVELHMAQKQCKKLGVSHEVFDLSTLSLLAPNSALTNHAGDVPVGHYAADNMKQTVVPNRNMVMISLALSYAMSHKYDELWYGAHSGDHTIYPDCRPEFVAAMQAAAQLADWHPVRLEAPYLHTDKFGILTEGFALGVDYAETWTCYRGDEERGACGLCGSCQERLEAFKLHGVKDPARYEMVTGDAL